MGEQPTSTKGFGNIVFTPRELDILACMAVGMTISKEIAQALGTSPKTIETHIAHILTKIQRRKRHHILLFIREEGLQQELSDLYHRQILSREVLSQPVDSFDFLQNLKRNLRKPKGRLVGTLVLLGFVLGVGYRFFSFHFISSYSLPIQASLVNLSQVSLLVRDNLMHKLEEAFSSHKDVTIVGLVGTGGVGKTTLARAYANAHSASLIFEINAERAETLLSSFNNLAYHLAQSPEQKTVLSEINALQDISTHTQRLLQFVQDAFYKQPSWLLIFDNVDDLPICRPFLPTSAWGRGKVILTTRNQLNNCR